MTSRFTSQGRLAQSLTCVATDASLTADSGIDPGLAWSHTFVEIGREIISMVIFFPSAE